MPTHAPKALHGANSDPKVVEACWGGGILMELAICKPMAMSGTVTMSEMSVHARYCDDFGRITFLVAMSVEKAFLGGLSTISN